MKSKIYDPETRNGLIHDGQLSRHIWLFENRVTLLGEACSFGCHTVWSINPNTSPLGYPQVVRIKL